MTVQYYLAKFSALKPDKSSGHAKPHKVCMLFAVMDVISKQANPINRFVLDETLKSRFSQHFAKLKQGNDQNSPHLPFYHLQSSGFWHLKIKTQMQAEFKAAPSITMGLLDRCVDYAYLDDELFDYLKSPITSSPLSQALSGNLDNLESQYQRWATKLGRSEKTTKNYIGALKTTIPKWLKQSGLPSNSLLEITDTVEYKKLTSVVMQVEEFKLRDTKGKGMYSAALKSYQSFLTDIGQFGVSEDIDDILQNKSIGETERGGLVKTRMGQGQFRTDLINHWQGCALTRYDRMPFLVASHIKPWSQATNSERLDPYNGLLLPANIDKAFDLGYITFNDKRKIKITEALDDHQSLGINPNMGIDIEPEHQDYMAYHREVVFEGKGA